MHFTCMPYRFFLILLHIYDFAKIYFTRGMCKGWLTRPRGRNKSMWRCLDDWKWISNGIITPSKLDKYHIWSVICSCEGNVLASGVNFIQMHIVDLSWLCLNTTLCGFLLQILQIFITITQIFVTQVDTYDIYTY